MNLAWMSNAPWASTGYGNQSRLFVPRIKNLGHKVHFIAFYGLEGGVINWGDTPVYPRGHDMWGNDVAAAHTKHGGADVLITLQDSWVLDPKSIQLHGVRWIPWFPVDMEPLPVAIQRKIKEAYKRIVFSRFGERMVNNAGMDCYYVPHGVDTNLYKPIDRQEAKKLCGLPDDKFIVGTVAANKGTPSRKALPEQLAAFAEFHKSHPDTAFYMHCTKSEHGEGQGVNLPELAEFLGLRVGVDVLFPDAYQQMLGYPDSNMNALYNCFDVFLLPSMGEGFGIPIVEAQAAGCPVIVGDWTAMGELCFSGWKIDKADAAPWWTPLAAYQFMPCISAITDTLEEAYKKVNPGMRERARDGARLYDADRVTRKYWKPVLEQISEAVGQWQPLAS